MELKLSPPPPRGVSDWTCGSFPRGALKMSWCSGLHLWIVPAWSLKNKEVLRIELVDRPAWIPKNQEVFWIGLVDCPRVEP